MKMLFFSKLDIPPVIHIIAMNMYLCLLVGLIFKRIEKKLQNNKPSSAETIKAKILIMEYPMDTYLNLFHQKVNIQQVYLIILVFSN